MKRNLLIVIFSIFTASLLLPGGYGMWTDILTIKGEIKVVEPPPPPTPSPMPTPMPEIPEGFDTAPVPENTEGFPATSPEDAIPDEGIPEQIQQEPGTTPEESPAADSGDEVQETGEENEVLSEEEAVTSPGTVDENTDSLPQDCADGEEEAAEDVISIEPEEVEDEINEAQPSVGNSENEDNDTESISDEEAAAEPGDTAEENEI